MSVSHNIRVTQILWFLILLQSGHLRRYFSPSPRLQPVADDARDDTRGHLVPGYRWYRHPGRCGVDSVDHVYHLYLSWMSGWWLSLPLWKIMEFGPGGMMKFPIYLEKHVPNHQPDVEHLKMGNNMGLCSTGICKRLSVGVPSNIFEPEKRYYIITILKNMNRCPPNLFAFWDFFHPNDQPLQTMVGR